MDSCDFNITVLDTEDPKIICPADKFVYLDGGECRAIVCYTPIFTSDNCDVVDTIYSIPSCSEFEIGVTSVEITIHDPAGNSISCVFEVTVIENEVDIADLACNDQINVSLTADCIAEINADMVLEGGNYICYENYIITIFDENGIEIPGSPIITIDYIHDTLTYTVTDPNNSNNSCSGIIVVDKKLEPEIACPVDTSIMCQIDPEDVDNNGELLTGWLTLLSCEGPVQITYADELVDNGDCGDPRVHISRTFYLVNSYDISVSCVQNISINPFNLNQILFPDDIVLECSDYGNNSDLTKPSNTGYPKLNDQNITKKLIKNKYYQ